MRKAAKMDIIWMEYVAGATARKDAREAQDIVDFCI